MILILEKTELEIARILILNGLLRLLRIFVTIHTDCKDLNRVPLIFGDQFAQLTELAYAVGSPVTTKKHQDDVFLTSV